MLQPGDLARRRGLVLEGHPPVGQVGARVEDVEVALLVDGQDDLVDVGADELQQAVDARQGAARRHAEGDAGHGEALAERTGAPSTLYAVSSALPEHLAVRVERVSKSFRIPHEGIHTLKERVVHPTRRRRFEHLDALRDVSFDVAGGEFFGIVGRNGSGKSTLMKCLAGIYRTDAGAMWLRGRMAPFIELGVGFNPDLTARDNVLINATMLGLTPAQARARYDDIIAFAELEQFVDLKLKNYSSGMHVRLAFAVMVHVDADVLLIDEVLAVGDAAFQQKCHDALNRAHDEGRTILLVTHDMTQVQRFCNRALLLDRGEMVAIGEPDEVTERYLQLNFGARVRARPPEPIAVTGVDRVPAGGGQTVVLDAWTQDAAGMRTDVLEQGRPCALCVRVRFGEAIDEPVFGFVVSDDHHRHVLALGSDWNAQRTGSFAAGETVVAGVSFDNPLAPGRYSIVPKLVRPGPGRLPMTDGEQEAMSVLVTGAGVSGGLVDIPHAFFVDEPQVDVAVTSVSS
jgi:ABC-type polysaccharide/polyol phosphate transport system ATPase subunit